MNPATATQHKHRAKIRVLVVDDSPSMCKLIQQIINDEPDMEVIGTASDPFMAREMIKALNPDVLTLDVEMPRMNGLDFLARLMRLRPMPVLMVSSLTSAGSGATMNALEAGAMDFVLKGDVSSPKGLATMAGSITGKLREIVESHPNFEHAAPAHAPAAPAAPKKQVSQAIAAKKLIFIGSSTGGTEALREFLSGMPASSPAILVTQHMPEHFTGSFAQRLNAASEMTVKEAVHNERIQPGHVYIAPGHSHLQVVKTGGAYYTALSGAEPVNRHRPSVDVLFESAAGYVGHDAIGILLTGMGKDGAVGMLKMREAGAYNFAQDEASCVVFGMPRAAIELKAAHEILPLSGMAAGLLNKLT
jgi:two-component system chemotaxis response regulator CheB